MQFVTLNYHVTNGEFTSCRTLIRRDVRQSETQTSLTTITPVVNLIQSCTSRHKSNLCAASVKISVRPQLNRAAMDTTNRIRYVWRWLDKYLMKFKRCVIITIVVRSLNTAKLIFVLRQRARKSIDWQAAGESGGYCREQPETTPNLFFGWNSSELA